MAVVELVDEAKGWAIIDSYREYHKACVVEVNELVVYDVVWLDKYLCNHYAKPG